MSRDGEKLIVLGSKRFVTNTDKPVWVQLPLAGERRDMVEGDRSVLISQQIQFDEERQKSTFFRLSGKIVNLFDNTVSGKTSYTPYRDSLFYTNSLVNAIASITNPNVAWEGYPQFYEFTLLREQGINGHIPYVAKSAGTYNWMTYITYPFSGDTTQKMSWTSERFSITNANFTVSDGIPFVIDSGSLNGKQLIYFYCATNHNLKIGDSVEIKLPTQPNGISNKKVFQVFSLGDGSYDSENYVFSIFNMKFNPNEVQTGTYGNFKRITNVTNSAETKSRYYIRLHKILTDVNDCKIFKAGFDRNVFGNKTKTEYASLTPNNTKRLSIKDDNQNYSFVVNKDIDINGLLDNNKKPVTELFLTIINRGYMGYFNPPSITSLGTQTGLDIGWGFNFLKNSIDSWWTHTSVVNKDEIPVDSYQFNGNTFYYNKILPIGSVLKGDFCEYNDYEQKEYLLSPLSHKYSFNQALFSDSSTPTLPNGYIYKPHYPIKIRVFSDYIEFGKKEDTDNIPFYSWFSESNQTFYWRDLYTYGYVDGSNNGVNYPFINGTHYINSTVIFKQYPINRSLFVETSLINTAQTDDCE